MLTIPMLAPTWPFAPVVPSPPSSAVAASGTQTALAEQASDTALPHAVAAGAAISAVAADARVARFQLKTDLAVQGLSNLARQVLSGPDLATIFPHYLIALHGIIRASEPLLQAAADEAQRRFAAGDASCQGLAEYFLEHKQEERDHALWLLQDIELLGIGPQAVWAQQPAAAIAALAGSQYYWIYHYHPGFLLGYLAVLEGYPLSRAQIARFQLATGFPDGAFRTLLKHAELDPGHGDELYQLLQRCQLDDPVFEGLATSAILSCGYLGEVLHGLRPLGA